LRFNRFVCAIVGSVVLFGSGVAIGQRGSVSKFGKYLRPAVRTEMDWIALEANVDVIRSSVPTRDDMTISTIYFDPKENRLEAGLVLYPDAEKAPLETVRTQIVVKYVSALTALHNQMPELSENDFVLRVFRVVVKGTDIHREQFAECRNRKVVFQ
jgi:hypothetical protein